LTAGFEAARGAALVVTAKKACANLRKSERAASPQIVPFTQCGQDQRQCSGWRYRSAEACIGAASRGRGWKITGGRRPNSAMSAITPKRPFAAQQRNDALCANTDQSAVQQFATLHR
jgi:hypothetical protein